MTDQETLKLSNVLLRVGPGNRMKVITKVSMMMKGYGKIAIEISYIVLK